MAANRLNESQKRELVELYRLGKSSSALAAAYRCSPNTVIRTVKALLPDDEYTALKAARSRVNSVTSDEETSDIDLKGLNDTHENQQSTKHVQSGKSDKGNKTFTSPVKVQENEFDLDSEESKSLALDDADDFTSELNEDNIDEEYVQPLYGNVESSQVFQEVIPLVTAFDIDEPKYLPCKAWSKDLLPLSVYMIVDKTVELESRALKEFSDLGYLSEDDCERKGLYLSSTQRSAKRYCGRNQRVIKVPDTSIFELTIPYLLQQGITRLVLDGSLIALDI